MTGDRCFNDANAMQTAPLRLLRLAVPCLLLALLAPLSTTSAQSAERIWGTVHTEDGERYEGFLRFGAGLYLFARGHAANWTDLLSGREDFREEPFRVWLDSARGGGPFLRTVELKGYRISWNELNDSFVRPVGFAVPFGSIREIIVHGVLPRPGGPATSSVETKIEAVLRPLSDDGEAGTGDLERRWLMGRSGLFWVGNAIEVEDPQGGRDRLYGAEILRIEFAAAPPGSTTASARLYGTMEDASGRSFTGPVIWGQWKLSPSDTLDEWADRSSPRNIALGSIRSVERLRGGTDGQSPAGVRVTLVTGDVVDLPDQTGRDSFSITVLDPGLGSVAVSSRDFRSLRFHDPAERRPDEAGYDAFADDTHLHGTVVTRSGDEHAGRIRWGTVKTTTWDHLRGSSDGVEMYVRFARIRRVEFLEFPYGDPVRTAGTEFEQGLVRVTLLDGRVYEMSGYDDLGGASVGILVLPAGQGEDSGWRRVALEELREVRFVEPPAGGAPPL